MNQYQTAAKLKPGTTFSKAALILTVANMAAAVALAIFAWGGMFNESRLIFVIAGIVAFTVLGFIVIARSRRLAGTMLGWVFACLLLFAPLLAQVFVTAKSSQLEQTLFAAIALWISGVAVASLLTAVLCTWLQYRAAALQLRKKLIAEP